MISVLYNNNNNNNTSWGQISHQGMPDGLFWAHRLTVEISPSWPSKTTRHWCVFALNTRAVPEREWKCTRLVFSCHNVGFVAFRRQEANQHVNQINETLLFQFSHHQQRQSQWADHSCQNTHLAPLLCVQRGWQHTSHWLPPTAENRHRTHTHTALWNMLACTVAVAVFSGFILCSLRGTQNAMRWIIHTCEHDSFRHN